MPVSTNSPATLTIRLRQTADTMSCRTPLYLLAFSPDIEVEGTESIATDNGIWNVATIANETSFPISIDRSERPCKAPLYRQEEAAQLPIDGALFIRDALLHVNAPGIYQLPVIDLSASSVPRFQASQPIARAGSRLSSSPPPATNTTYLAFLNPSISYGGGHHGNGSGLDFDASSGVYSAQTTIRSIPHVFSNPSTAMNPAASSATAHLRSRLASTWRWTSIRRSPPISYLPVKR